MIPVAEKATMLAKPVLAVCAPFDIPTVEPWRETDGVASKVAVKVPLCDGKAVFNHAPLAVAVVQTFAGFTVRLTVVLWFKLPLVPVMAMGPLAAVLEVETVNVELPEPVTEA